MASGRVLIRALDSIKQAGLDELGRPKRAIARADHKRVALGIGPREDACFAPMAWSNKFGGRWVMTQHRSMAVPGLRIEQHVRHDWAAVVPLIPVHLRPRAAIENYHVLWEAEWTAQPPVDPMLLRRMTGDLWIVVAAWDLTEVERAAMASRLSS